MNPKKIKPVIRDMANTKEVHRGSSRLVYRVHPTKTAIDYPRLAEELKAAGPNHQFVLDTSFFARHEIDECLWEALVQRTVFITRHVWDELQPWLTNPFNNQRMAERIRRAATSPDLSVVLDHRLTWEADCCAGRSYYTSLSSVRKQRSRYLVEEYRARYGREPAPEELNQLFQMSGSARDFQLLKKGLADFGKTNYFADEDLLATAATIGLRTGRPVTILTRDGDLLDQFQKLTSLLTIHYQALLFAEAYALAPDEFRTSRMPVSAALASYFDCGESFLVKKPVNDPDDFVGWLLPFKYQRLSMTCALLGGHPPDMTLSFFTYAAEKDMVRLIRTKGATGGRSTDRLGPKNCHVTGFPEGIEDPRGWVIVAADKTETFRGTTLAVPRLDLRHVIEHREVLRRMPSMSDDRRGE